MMEESKVAAARGYLCHAFPNCPIHDKENFDRIAQEFRNAEKSGGVIHKVIVSREFLEDNAPAEIERKLMAWKLADTVRRASGAEVSVTNDGVKVNKPA